MTTQINIERKRGDTCGIVFVVTDEDDVIVPVGLWTAFLLTVDPEKAPVNADNNIFQVSGAFVTNGDDGKVRFFPPGTSDIGTYRYDVQALNVDSKICTIAEGKYKLTQDITKD